LNRPSHLDQKKTTLISCVFSISLTSCHSGLCAAIWREILELVDEPQVGAKLGSGGRPSSSPFALGNVHEWQLVTLAVTLELLDKNISSGVSG
jgi:hypothetical protein